ncbi:MAG: lysyl oxidase family protein [Acidimicrobiales bacterium]
MRPQFPLANSPIGTKQKAFQQVLTSRDSSGAVVCERDASAFTYHPTHRHWHTEGVAEFELRVGSPTGPAFVNDLGGQVKVKTTFCLIDWVKLVGSSTSGKNTTRTYFDCAGPFHGVSVDWTDQYHHATDDQDLDITGVKPGVTYYLVSTTNAGREFIEKDYTNNSAWQAFRVSRDSQGNPKIALGGYSLSCLEVRGLCGEQTSNR